jgi:hypothetical protein
MEILGQFEVSGVYMVIPFILNILNSGLKTAFNMPSKYTILINWFGGVGLAILLAPFGTPPVEAGIIGFFAGSSASGLYDGLKQYLKDDTLRTTIPPRYL